MHSASPQAWVLVWGAGSVPARFPVGRAQRPAPTGPQGRKTRVQRRPCAAGPGIHQAHGRPASRLKMALLRLRSLGRSPDIRQEGLLRKGVPTSPPQFWLFTRQTADRPLASRHHCVAVAALNVHQANDRKASYEKASLRRRRSFGYSPDRQRTGFSPQDGPTSPSQRLGCTPGWVAS